MKLKHIGALALAVLLVCIFAPVKPVAAGPYDIPSGPLPKTIVTGESGDASAILEWKLKGNTVFVNRFVVYEINAQTGKEKILAELPPSSRRYEHTNPKDGKTYRYMVRAFSISGDFGRTAGLVDVEVRDFAYTMPETLDSPDKGCPLMVVYSPKTGVIGDKKQIDLKVKSKLSKNRKVRYAEAEYSRKGGNVVLCNAAWQYRWKGPSEIYGIVNPNPREGVIGRGMLDAKSEFFILVTARRVKTKTGSSCDNPYVAWFDALAGISALALRGDTGHLRWNPDSRSWSLSGGMRQCSAEALLQANRNWSGGGSKRKVPNDVMRLHIAYAKR